MDALEAGAGGENPGPLVGKVLKGKYRVTHRLATGSLGVTYLAEDRSTHIRLVLKVFRSEFGRDHALVDKMRQQMQAVATLSQTHPNIVRVYDCDVAEDDTLFLAMEQLVGRTLRDVIREAVRLEIGRALRIAGQMASGLNAAHDARLVHTDVRPESFMVLGTDDAIKLFGFERARLRNMGAMDRLVPSSGITRTPEYTAPEQIQKRDITHQTDIYAFGVVLYEMLTGVVPFRASTPEEVLAMHLKTAPTYPKALRPDIPVEVEAKVMQALEKEPKWRENSAREVVGEWLRGAVGVRPQTLTPMRGPRTASPVEKEAGQRTSVKHAQRRLWWLVGAMSGLLILMVAAAIWMLYPRRPEVISEPPLTQMPEQAARPVTEKEAGKEAAEPPRALPEERPPEAPVATEETREKEDLVQKEQKEEVVQKKALAQKKDVAPRKRVEAKPSQPSQPPAPSASRTPGTTRETPDPSEVIDWLFRGR